VLDRLAPAEILRLQQEDAGWPDENMVEVALSRIDVMDDGPTLPDQRPEGLGGGLFTIGALTPTLEDEIVESGLLQPHGGGDRTEAGADDRDVLMRN
jgi:hypothetical protein